MYHSLRNKRHGGVGKEPQPAAEPKLTPEQAHQEQMRKVQHVMAILREGGYQCDLSSEPRSE